MAGAGSLLLATAPELYLIKEISETVKAEIQDVWEFIKATTAAFRPMDIELFQRAWNDLYATFGFSLSPIVEEVTAQIRDIADISAGTMFELRADVLQLVAAWRELRTELGPLFREGVAVSIGIAEVALNAFIVSMREFTAVMNAVPIRAWFGGIAELLAVHTTPTSAFGMGAGYGGQHFTSPADAWVAMQSESLKMSGLDPGKQTAKNTEDSARNLDMLVKLWNTWINNSGGGKISTQLLGVGMFK
jgi:hypothetical protein